MKKPSFTTATTVLAAAWMAHFAADQEEGGMTDSEWNSWVLWTLGLATPLSYRESQVRYFPGVHDGRSTSHWRLRLAHPRSWSLP